MKNIGYYVGLLGGVWLLLTALRRTNSGDWRYRAQALLGGVGIALGGVALCEPPHLHATREARTFYSLESLLVGVFIGVFVALCMAGWFKEILGKQLGRREQRR
jgi:hypothetical protein